MRDLHQICLPVFLKSIVYLIYSCAIDTYYVTRFSICGAPFNTWAKGIFQTTYPSAISLVEKCKLLLKFYWTSFPMVQQWSRWWFVAEQVRDHCLKKKWLGLLMYLYITGPQWFKKIGLKATISWWLHVVEMLSKLLALCMGDHQTPVDPCCKWPVMPSFDVFFVVNGTLTVV